MTELNITPNFPLPERGQPAIVVTFTCVMCGTQHTVEQSAPGFIPRYCPAIGGKSSECQRKANADRVKRWRERNPQAAKAAAKKANDARPRKGRKK